MQFYPDAPQRQIFPEELNMHSTGPLVKAIGTSQNTHFVNNKEKLARILVLSSFKTELIKILNWNTYSLEKLM